MLAVIPPGTIRRTRGDQVDGTANLTCEDSTTYHPLDGWEPTHYSEGRRFESDLGLQQQRARPLGAIWVLRAR
jgi:hypothetical protein